MYSWVCFQVLLAKVARPVLQLILLAIFLFYFGLPAIETYAKKEVIVVEHNRDTNGIPFPAITVAAWDQNEPDSCYGSSQPIEKCIEESSLNSSDLLKAILRGYELRSSINLTKNMLTEDSTNSWSGIYYTLNLPLNIGPDDYKDQIYIFLSNITLEYSIFVHDPKFFIYSNNPVALRMETRSFNTRASDHLCFRLNLIEMNELDVPSDPCNANPDYNFHLCVKRSVTEKVSVLCLYSIVLCHDALLPFLLCLLCICSVLLKRLQR